MIARRRRLLLVFLVLLLIVRPSAAGRHDPCESKGQAKRHPQNCEPIGGGSGVARGDFNGDGIGDLAVGAPDENVNGATDAGAVHVIYGSATGLTSAGNQFFTQDSQGVAGVPEANDRFGLTLAAGEFNGDSFSDLAIGVPFEDIDGTADEGLVQILHGSSAGLQPAGSFELLAISPGFESCACRFGGALAWGDFDADGTGDLAIGMPRFSIFEPQPLNPFTRVTGAGAVVVLFGSEGTGLSSSGHQLWAQTNFDAARFINSIGDRSEGEDHFGATLAAGDHNGDGFDDLAIGVPQEDLFLTGGTVISVDAGLVHVVFGSASGLSTSSISPETYNQGSGFVSGASESGDQFGQRLAMGDATGDGVDELAVGVPFEDVGSDEDAGAVFVLNRANRSSQGWDQDRIPGVGAEPGDHFGWAIAFGDFNGNNLADLAIGVPDEDFGNPFVPSSPFVPRAGLVHVLYGTSSGLTTTNAQIWHQDVSGVPNAIGVGDQFGFSLSAWNFGGTTHRDLAIGIPGEDVTTDTRKDDAGAVLVLYGSANRLTTTGIQMWTQASAGILDAADTDDRFGASVY